MASVYPSISEFRPLSLGQQRELDVIESLARSLPESYAVFHSVLYSTVREHRQWFGEIDAIVLAPSGDMVLIEVKAGPVEFSEKGIHKQYDQKSKNILHQLHLQHGSLRQRLKEAQLRVFVSQLLVVPDVTVVAGTIGYPRERIIDREDFADIGRRVMGAVPPQEAHSALFERVKRFLCNVYRLAADPTARIGWLNSAVNQLSDGLATWVPRLTTQPSRYLVRATAGAGKTQLAIRLLAEAEQEGLKVAYFCFNRPLADHLRQLLPQQAGHIQTFHELAVARWAVSQSAPDYHRPDTFEKAAQAFCASEDEETERADLDLLIIDEAQDFSAEWVCALERRLKAGGRLYVLDDPDQRLYRRGDMDWRQTLALTAEVTSFDNFRSPRRITETLNALRLTPQPIEPCCPVAGEVPGFHIWEQDDTGGMKALACVIADLLEEGIRPEQMALLSFTGRERSVLLQNKEMAGQSLCRFTGDFDTKGQPAWTKGTLLAETLYRFKGQAAPVVVLCEIDFNELDAVTRRRLFVGMTRAQWRLECVLSPRAAQALSQVLG